MDAPLKTDAPNAAPRTPAWSRRHALGLIAVAPLAPALFGSAFNIWYNVIHIRPLFVGDQEQRFHDAIALYNAVVYPVLTGCWIYLVMSMRRAYRGTLAGESVDPDRMRRARVRAINLPWHFVVLLVLGWGGCLPSFVFLLGRSDAPVADGLPIHLSISLAIAALITITHALFVLELLAQKLLFPVLFQDADPSRTPGAITLSLGRRAILWALSAGACPIASLLLLGMVDHGDASAAKWFMLSVGLVGVTFGLGSAFLLCRLIVRPVERLRDAANAVAAGDLSTRVDLLRADEFGPLIGAFNDMVDQMRAKQRLQETFGLHVGRGAAEQILAADPGLGGKRRTVTVLFCDIRGFTARTDTAEAESIVSMLNRFFSAMVATIEEEHGGMVNKFLGDGLMALFGAAGEAGHADAAVSAARRMLDRLSDVNAGLTADGHEPIRVGIGVHTGEAVVGNIGADKRLEYTAIGPAVNLAARVEAMTKQLDRMLLITGATRATLSDASPLTACGAHTVRGVAEPVELFSVS